MSAESFYLGFGARAAQYSPCPDPRAKQRVQDNLVRLEAAEHEQRAVELRAGLTARPQQISGKCVFGVIGGARDDFPSSLAFEAHGRDQQASELRARLKITNFLRAPGSTSQPPVQQRQRAKPRFSDRALAAYAKAPFPRAFAFRASTSNAPAEILLYDQIGDYGTSASDFANALSQAGAGPLTLRINSPGGDVFDGYAIYNMLRARAAPVSVIIDGIAASAASFIAMAGQSVAMGEPAMLMIHNAGGACFGDRNDMSDMADVLGLIDGQIAAVYAAKTGQPLAAMAALMDAETWYTSSGAMAAGFCDSVLAAPAKNAAVAAALRRMAQRLSD